ncbi:MAG: hypothetical protein ACK5AR_05330 [Flavobacteriia bacterium]|jgi:hypothetical protein
MNQIKLNKRIDLGKSATWLWIIVTIITMICNYFSFDLMLSMAKLLFAIPLFYHTWTIAKESKITLVAFSYDEQHFKFYFQWGFKDPKSYNRSDVLIEAKEDTIEFKAQSSADTIGIIHIKQLVNETDWSLLVGLN